jgi:hypothetical protein
VTSDGHHERERQMFIFRSARSQAGAMPVAGEGPCDHPDAAMSDPSRRVSSHRTSQGHVVYYRCDCGVTRLGLMRWSRESSSGATRLR